MNDMCAARDCENDDRTTIEIICYPDHSCRVEVRSDEPAFNAFPVVTKKSELIAQIVCHNVKELLAMDKHALMERHLEMLNHES